MYLRTLRQLQKAAAKMQNSRIVVVTQEKYAEIIDAAKEIGAEVLINPQPERGISSSMQIGLLLKESHLSADNSPVYGNVLFSFPVFLPVSGAYVHRPP